MSNVTANHCLKWLTWLTDFVRCGVKVTNDCQEIPKGIKKAALILLTLV